MVAEEASPRETSTQTPLRVLLVVEAALGGLGLHVCDLARALKQRGHHVQIVYAPTRMDQMFRDFLIEAESLDIPTTSMPLGRSVGFSDLAMLRRLRKLVREQGPFDILHGHSSKAGALVRLAGGGKRGRTVYTPNALVTMDPQLGNRSRRAYAMVERKLGIRGDLLIAVAPEERDHALELGIPASKVTMIPNGTRPLDTSERDAVRQELGLGTGELCVGAVGRMVPQKAPERLIEAWAKISPSRPNARLVIVGAGALLESCKELATKLGVSERITFLGEALGRRYIPAFDVFALSSRYEGNPYVLIEALSAGIPMVTTRVSGSTGTVEPGVNGYIVEQDDPEGFAQSIGELLDDEAMRARFSQAARDRFRLFTIDHMAEETLRVYRRLIHRP